MTFADKLDNKLESILGTSFEVSTNDDMLLVLAVTGMKITKVDMDDESITASFYGYAVGGSIYNSDMVEKNGGAATVAREFAESGVAPSVVATTRIFYLGDDASEMGKALVSLRDVAQSLSEEV